MIECEYKIVLGSSSPRRKEIMEMIFPEFTIKEANIKEISKAEVPEMVAVEISKLKNEAITINEDEVLITADTIVVINDKILGKPKNREEAINMLQMLSGKKHVVITGVTVRCSKFEESFYDVSEVYFRELQNEIIKYYVDNMNPLDKAGSYGIQDFGSIFIEKITGDYYNVMGLPISKLFEFINKKELINFKG